MVKKHTKKYRTPPPRRRQCGGSFFSSVPSGSTIVKQIVSDPQLMKQLASANLLKPLASAIDTTLKWIDTANVKQLLTNAYLAYVREEFTRSMAKSSSQAQQGIDTQKFKTLADTFKNVNMTDNINRMFQSGSGSSSGFISRSRY
jgi:hypothetical protein